MRLLKVLTEYLFILFFLLLWFINEYLFRVCYISVKKIGKNICTHKVAFVLVKGDR